MDTFENWELEFKNQNLFAFNGNSSALLWLKVRAVCRAKLIEKFLEQNNMTLASKKVAEKNKELFDVLSKNSKAMKILDAFFVKRK